MNRKTALLLCVVFLSQPILAMQAFDDTVIANVTYPGWFKQSFYDLREDLTDVETAGKRGLLLFFSTQGCSYCHLMLNRAFSEPAFVDRLSSDFDVVGLEIFDDIELTDWHGETLPIKAFAVREGVQFSPTLVFYDRDGRRLLRLAGYFETDRLTDALDYLDSGVAPATTFRDWIAGRRSQQRTAGVHSAGLMADPLFEAPPYQLDRSTFAAERPLAVIFERGDCTRCNTFHERVLADEDVRTLLKGFEVVQLDAGDADTRLVAPHGSVLSPAAWYRDLVFTELPAIALFDERGKKVLTTDALVLEGRFINSLRYVLQRAYADGWTYQRFARSESIRRLSGAGTDQRAQ